MFQEKLRLQGTQMTFPTHMYNVLYSVLVKKMAMAAMLRHIRKTLRCNQVLLGGRGFREINRLCQPIGLWLGKPSITNICCPLCQKNQVRAGSGVLQPKHRMPEAASWEPESQGSTPWAFLSQCHFRKGSFCWNHPPTTTTTKAVSQREPSSGLWIMTILFSMKYKHKDIFFLSTALTASSGWCPQQ